MGKKIVVLNMVAHLKYDPAEIEVDHKLDDEGRPELALTVIEPPNSAWPLLMRAQAIFNDLERLQRSETGSLAAMNNLREEIIALEDGLEGNKS